MHARYVQGMSLPSVGWGGQVDSLPETHQQPFAFLNAKAETASQPKPVHLVRDRRWATLKNPTEVWLWKQKCLQLGWGRRHLACCWRGHPPGSLGSSAIRPTHQPFCQQGSLARAVLQPLAGHWYLQGCSITSCGHPNYTASIAQWGSQSHSVGKHEKCQAWASSHSCPLTAVEPQTKTSTVWVSDNVRHWRPYSVIFMGGKKLEGEILIPRQELLMPSFMKWERHVWAIPKHKLDG